MLLQSCQCLSRFRVHSTARSLLRLQTPPILGVDRKRPVVACGISLPHGSYRVMRIMLMAALLLIMLTVFCWTIELGLSFSFWVVVCVQSNWIASKKGWTRSIKTWGMQRKTWRVWKSAADSASCHGNGKYSSEVKNRTVIALLKMRNLPCHQHQPQH